MHVLEKNSEKLKISNNSKNDINGTVEHDSYNKTRVLPKRSVAILGEIKRRFDSDRW